jgi:hypothetical protein
MAGIFEHSERAESRADVEVRAAREWTPERIAAERNGVPTASLREQRSLERARFERLATRVSSLLAAHSLAQRRGRFTR